MENEKRLATLMRIINYHAKNENDFLDYALHEAIAITESKIGYLYYYDEKTRLFTLNTWSQEVMEECRIMDKQTTYELDRTGIWGEAVRQRRPIMVNDFEAPNKMKRGCPEGHVSLKSFLTVPVFQDEKIVAVIGVANKENPYNENDVSELTLIMDAVWKMCERDRIRLENLKIKDQLFHSEKLAALGTLSASIAHEINNPVNIISGMIGLIKPTTSKEDTQKYLERIRLASGRLKTLVHGLSNIARLDSEKDDKIDIHTIIHELVDIIRPLMLKGSGVEISEKLLATKYYMFGNTSKLQQVILNLIGNAKDALMEKPNGGMIIVETLNKDNHIFVKVIDNGPGISSEVFPKIFDDYFTTKPAGKGTGLGLPICKKIIEGMNGEIIVESEAGKGASFIIKLPFI